MKTKLLRLTSLLLAAVVLLGGCMTHDVGSSSGTPIDPAKVALIVKNKTTRAEIESWFGKPDNTSMLPDGRRSLSYNYSQTDMHVSTNPLAAAIPINPGAMARTNGTTKTQSLQIYVTKDSIVEDYEFNDSTRNIQGDAMGNTRTTKG